MSVITLETAKTHLSAWLQAELAITTGQSYKIGTRQLNRADLGEIREQIKFWKNEIAKLEVSSKYKGARRVFRAIPRDL